MEDEMNLLIMERISNLSIYQYRIIVFDTTVITDAYLLIIHSDMVLQLAIDGLVSDPSSDIFQYGWKK